MDRIKKILTMLENGQHKQAESEYNEVLTLGTHDEKYLLGEELFQLGFLEEAKRLFEDLLEIYPDEGELLVLLAEVLIEAGNEEQATLMLERISETDPSFGQSLLLLADLYQIQGLYEVCEGKLLKAKAIMPEEIVIDFALGELYSEQGEITSALQAYTAVLKEQSDIAGVNINQRIADLLSASGAFEEALPYYEKSLSERLEINTLFGYAFTALQGGFNRTAIEKFLELKELDPEYNSLYLPLAEAYEREEELENSIDVVQQGIKHDDFNKELLFYGGKLALKLGREEEAEKYLREALVLDPGFTEAAINLDTLLIKQEKFDLVIELLNTMDIQEENEPQLLWDAAFAYEKLEDYERAMEKYESAYPFFKEDESFLSDFGYFLIEEGKSDRAAEIFKQLLKNNPSNEEYHDLLERLTDIEN
ncbi:MAG: tetratricopeptide repeat protein [Bacillota bacterium]|nr:tetratricopeptide repeat protein [Bacillota bacterium]